MKVSIIICTRNRADSLARALHSILDAAREWTTEWELIVVNNGSADHTEDAVSDCVKEAPSRIRLIEEPRRGVSYAKNRGIRAAAADVIAFTDDDCLIQSQWLPAVCTAFQADKATGVVAGRTELFDPMLFPHCVRTSRVQAEYRWPVGPDFMSGNNLALRASVFDAVGGFDVRLGPGTRAYAAEDGDMVYRVLKAGFVGKYVPEALVYHDHRRTVEELRPLRRNYAVGNGAYLTKHVLKGDLYALKMAYWQLQWLFRRGSESDYADVVDRKAVIRAILVGAGIRLLGLR